MPSIIRLLLALSILASGAARAQSTASASAACVIVNPVQVRTHSPLALDGLRVSAQAGGTVSIGTSGQRSYQGSVALREGNCTAARFTVSGDSQAGFEVRLPEHCALKLTNGTQEVRADGFICTRDVSMDVTGTTQCISIGATVHLGAGQPVGTYVGEFDVTVAYQ